MTSAVATLALGLVAMPAAHALVTLDVTPASGLTDGQLISIELDGYTPGPLVSAQVAECGNAYANGTPLSTMPVVVSGVLDSVNCEVIGFRSEGTMNTAPVTVSGPSVTARETGIGHGNRSCVAAAIGPCFIYVATSVNSDAFPQEDITFATDPSGAGAEPAVTETTVTAVGTPVGLGKNAHAMVTVSVPTDPTLTPDGSVQVYEDATLLGSGVLDGTAHASIDIGTPALGLHDLSASFVGNGSFAPSDSASPSTLSIIPAKNISIGDASLVEGDSPGPRVVIFPVVLSALPTASTWVNYSIVPSGGNPATIGVGGAPGVDIAAQTNKTMKFAAGKATVKYISVKVYGNTNDDGNRTFAVQLSDNSTNGGFVLRRPTGNGLIIDDDSPPSAGPFVSIGSSSVPEGDVGGAHVLKMTVSLSTPVNATVTAFLQVSNATAEHGTKLAGDWGGAINRKIVFRANQISKPLGVGAFPDLRSELDETVKVRITSVTSTGPSVDIGANSTVFGIILSDE